MQNRMDKYSVNPKTIGSRTERNKELYESVRTSSMKNYEIKSNISIIDNDASSINVGKVRKMIDERYSDSSPKRRSIEIPDFAPTEVENNTQDTKEYDINAILAKAKVGKNVDYNKERLKKVRDTQYEILNNLDLELKREDFQEKSKSKEDAENNLMNLINTITELEIKNKNKNISSDSDLLDLTDDSDDVTEPNRQYNDKIDVIKPIEENNEEETCNEIRLIRKNNSSTPSKTEKIEKNDAIEISEKIEDNSNTEKNISMSSIENNQEIKKTKTSKKDDEHIEKTLSKLDINMSSYEDFADISKRDKGTLIIKIIIFIIIIVLVLGAIYILNDILNLGLF